MNMFRYLPAAVVAAALCVALSQTPTLAADAKPPTKVAFQGFLTDNAGAALGASAPVQKTVIFRVYSDATAGTLKWSEQQAVTVDKGHFSVALGEGSAASDTPVGSSIAGSFAGADASERWMELSVDGNILTPRIQFATVPYALLAKSANQLVGTDGAAVITPGVGTLTLAGTTSGTFSGDGQALLNLNGANLQVGSVATTKIADLNVTTAKIADAAVTTAKIADLNVTTAKIANSSVTDSKIASTPDTANTANTIVKRDASSAINVNKVFAVKDVQVASKSVVTGFGGYEIVAGVVNADGTVSSGTGFTSSKLNFAGYYRVEFPGRGAPISVMLTPEYNGYVNEQAWAATAAVEKTFSGGFDVFTKYINTQSDIRFHFIAIFPSSR